MKNHLFIGIGGQGGRSLAEVRKVMEQRYRDRDQLAADGAKWEFLSIDSSRDVWNTRKFWNHFGTDLRLTANQQFDMKTGMLGANLDAYSVDPTISPWLGQRSFIANYLAADKGTPGANQRRRFGRFLFARNADALRQTLITKVSAMTAAASYECCFHVFATLAGGTGSGGIIDLVTTLRDLYPDASPANGFPIYLYLYVTSRDGSGADIGYFYQNQFAALRDLNALMAGRLKPTMLDAQHGGKPFDGGTPVTAALLATSLNSGRITMPIEAQIKVMAESCFERIYAYLSGNLTPSTQQSMTLEDIIATFAGEPQANPERSYRFGSLGMRRWEVPNEKIEELIALELTVSALRQMLYNHWLPGSGYGESAVKANEGQLGQIATELQGIVDARTLRDTEAEALRRECRDAIDQSLEGRIKKPTPENELALLERDAAAFFDHGLAGTGLKARVAAVRAMHNASADDAVAAVDQALTRYWLEAAAPVGLVGLIECLDRFIVQLTASVNLAAERTNGPDIAARRLPARRDEWEKITFLSRTFGKRTELLRAHAEDLKSKHLQTLGAQVEDSDVALKRLLVQPLQTLRAAYATAQTHLLQMLKDSNAALTELDTDLRDLRNPQNAVRYEFDQDKLDGFRKLLRGDQVSLAAVSAGLRSQVVGLDRTLRGFDADEAVRAEDDLRNAAVADGRNIHSTLVTRGTITPVLGDSLMDRLQQRFRNDPQGLATAAREFLERATSCVHLDTGQMSPAIVLGSGAGVPPMPRRILVLGVPQHPFSAEIQRAILDAVPANLGFVSDHYVHQEPSQLRLFVCDYWMAARYVSVVAELADKYKTGRDRTEIAYFCNIDPEGEADRRPDLFLPTLAELQARLAADFWLGEKLGAVIANADGVSLITRTEQGTRVEPVGATVAAVRDRANLADMLKINTAVSVAAAGLTPDRKREILDHVKAEESAREQKHGLTSTEYREWQGMRPYLNRMLS